MNTYNRALACAAFCARLCAASLTIFSVGSTADTLTHYALTSEHDLLDKKVVSNIDDVFWNSHVPGTAPSKSFKGHGDVAIAYAQFVQADPLREKGAIVIVTGRTETYLKYKELIFDLWSNGFSVYIYDHRGQGLSDREAAVAEEKDREKGYVGKFSYYVEDLDAFLNTVVSKDKHAHIFLLAHSMGGAIATLYLEGKSSDSIKIDAVALTSPMHAIQGLGGASAEILTCPLTKLRVRTQGASYAWNGSGYEAKSFSKNEYTTSEVRYDRLVDEYKLRREVRLGAPTYQWLAEACEASRIARSNAGSILQPVILFEAAEDTIVGAGGNAKFCRNLKAQNKLGCGGEDGGPIPVAGAKHELLIGSDAQRNFVIAKILEFFELHSPK